MKIEELPFKYRIKDYWHRFGLPKFYNSNNMIYNMFYDVWVGCGVYTGFVRKYNTKKQIALENARQALEEAFTPQLKSMLSKKLQDGK